MFEQETLAILQSLLKWKDKLQGYKINVVTDHKALEFFDTQKQLSGRQMQWMEYLVCFDYNIQYMKGQLNKVADALSWYYKSDTWYDVYPPDKYVNVVMRNVRVHGVRPICLESLPIHTEHCGQQDNPIHALPL